MFVVSIEVFCASRIFDKDDDGFISVEELRHIMQVSNKDLPSNKITLWSLKIEKDPLT